MMKYSLFGTEHLPPIEYISFLEILFLVIPFLIAILSGVRLAKFNLDVRQSDSFIGLAVPANAIFFASLYLVSSFSEIHFLITLINNKYVLSILVIIFSLLLVSEFPMFSLKIKSIGLQGNKIRYLFAVLSAILLILLHTIAIPGIIILYILLSAVNNWIYKFK